MNMDTSELAVVTYHVWSSFRSSFLNKNEIHDYFHTKFFARLDAKQGLTLIMQNLLGSADPLMQARHYIKCAQLTPVQAFLPDIGFDLNSKENEKKNVKNFFSFMQAVFQKPVTNSETIAVVSDGWPDIIKTVQEKCEKFVCEETGYRCAEKWSDICENARPKIDRDLKECVAKCAMLNENTVCYLLKYHLSAEIVGSRIQDAVARKEFVFSKKDTEVVNVHEYTMRCVVDEMWGTIISSIQWDMECLETSFKNILNAPAPIAISNKNRHTV